MSEPEAKAAAAEPAPETATQGQSPATSSATDVAAPPPADAERIMLPPMKPAPLAHTYPVPTFPRFDRFLLVLLIIFVAFLSSFAIGNSDFWLHLATGRLIAQGEYQFGTDPFSLASEGTWINHAWLFDLLLYWLYSAVGGPGVAIFRAVLVVALMLVLLGIRRKDQGRALPVMVLALSVLVMSPRFLLQPALMSYLMFGIVLWVLWKPRAADDSPRRLWWLPVLFALWVNLDGWFILGLVLLVLAWLGAVLQRLTDQAGHTEQPGHPPAKLGLVSLASALACLANPHLHQAFTLPTELGYLLVTLSNALGVTPPDSLVAAGKTVHILEQNGAGQLYLMASPFSSQYLELLGANTAGFAFFVLVLLSFVSFGLALLVGRRAGDGGLSRLLAWLVFLILSLASFRLIVFFALVAAPVTVLNLQDFARGLAAGRTDEESPASPWGVLGRLGLTLLFLPLLVTAWPGWLHTSWRNPAPPRRVTWGVDFDPTWELMARQLRAIHEKAGGLRFFAYAADVAHYCAWYCPEVKGCFDLRFGLFQGMAAEYARVQRELRVQAEKYFRERAPADYPEWKALAKKRDINAVVLRDPSVRGFGNLEWLMQRLCLDARRWPLLYADGRNLVFGWRAAREDGPFDTLALDLNMLAFGPQHVRAPDQGPDRELKAANFLARFALGPAPRPLDADRSRWYFNYNRYFLGSMPSWGWPYLGGWWLGCWAVPTGLCGVAPGSVLQIGALGMDLWFSPQFVRNGRAFLKEDQGVPAAVVLAMRAARRAVADNPLEPEAHLAVFLAAEAASEFVEDYWTSTVGGAPRAFRTELRLLQRIAALKNVVALAPTDANMHGVLKQIYLQHNYLDVAVEHAALEVKHLDRLRPATSDKTVLKAFSEQKKAREEELKLFNRELQERRNAYELRAARKDALQKYEIALVRPYREHQGRTEPIGLAYKALEGLNVDAAVLKKMDPFEVRALGLTQMKLLLMLGRSAEVRDALREKNVREVLGDALPYIETMAAAVAGDYLTLEKSLTELETTSVGPQKFGHLFIAILIPDQTLAGPARVLSTWNCCSRFLTVEQQVSLAQAQFRLLRGIFALEHGEVASALRPFQEVLDLVPADLTYAFPERRIAERYAALILAQQKK